MAKTSLDLATRALQILGTVSAGQPVSSEDLFLAMSQVDPLLAQLAQLGEIYFGEADAIDDAAFLPLARRLALELAPDFGLPAPDLGTIRAADAELRRLAWRAPAAQPVVADYF